MFELTDFASCANDANDADDAVDVLLMSAAWRPAALELLDGARDRWSPRQLARWLLGPYREATWRLPRLERAPSGETPKIERWRIAAVLSSARKAVVDGLRVVHWGGGPVFVRTAIRDRAIVPTKEGFWVPLDKPRMLLKDRVLALFAADYLLRPQDYVGDLVICAKCEKVVFDPAARQTGYCGAHRISGFLEAHWMRSYVATGTAPFGPG